MGSCSKQTLSVTTSQKRKGREGLKVETTISGATGEPASSSLHLAGRKPLARHDCSNIIMAMPPRLLLVALLACWGADAVAPESEAVTWLNNVTADATVLTQDLRSLQWDFYRNASGGVQERLVSTRSTQWGGRGGWGIGRCSYNPKVLFVAGSD